MFRNAVLKFNPVIAPLARLDTALRREGFRRGAALRFRALRRFGIVIRPFALSAGLRRGRLLAGFFRVVLFLVTVFRVVLRFVLRALRRGFRSKISFGFIIRLSLPL